MIYEFSTTSYTLGTSPGGTVAVRPRLTVKRIQDIVACRYGVTTGDMLSARRSKDVALARQVAMYLARQLTPKSLPDLGGLFNRDHTTVLHGCKRIKWRLDSDPDLLADVRALRERLAA